MKSSKACLSRRALTMSKPSRQAASVLFATLAAAGTGCAKKSSSTTTAATSTSTISGAGGTTGGITVSSLSQLPTADTFLKAESATASLSDRLALDDRGDGYSLVTGTPPNFTAIAANITTLLTGDPAALTATINADRLSQNWADMKTQIGDFFDAETKCGVMEHTARIVERLKEDSAPLCLLQAIGPVGDKVYRVESGAAIADLTTVFTQETTDKVLQIGNTDKGQPHYEIVQITGSANSPTGYHAVYTMCLTATKKGFRQNTLNVVNASGAFTFSSLTNGALNDKGPKPDASFSLGGQLTAGATGGFVADPTATRLVSFHESGTIGQLTAAAQAELNITGNQLSATYFATESGTDAGGNTTSRSDKTALDVEYTGTAISDLVIFQGAGRSVISVTGTNVAGTSVSNADDRTIGFAFDNTASPEYATAASTSAYVTSIAAVDFATDSVLSLTSPTAPAVASIDDTVCAATPTTVLNYVDKPEDNGTYAAALAACNTTPAATSQNMCDAIRNLEHSVNASMFARKAATGSATK